MATGMQSDLPFCMRRSLLTSDSFLLGDFMHTRLIAFSMLALGAGLIGCADVTPDGDDALDEANLHVVTSYDEDSDIAGFHYDITAVDCDNGDALDGTEEAVKDLKELTLPGGFERFENNPYDSGSNHAFADYLTLVDAGCYDVTVTPVDAYDQPIDSCLSATQNGVLVEDGEMTEILLISQCEGAQKGLLDVVASVNFPPHLTDFNILDNKFAACGEDDDEVTVKVCAFAEDPDGDPLEFVWTPEPDESSITEKIEDGRVGECVEYTLSESVTDYNVTVYDLFRTGVGDDDFIRAEDFYLDSPNYPDEGDDDAISSRASQNYDIHVSCDPEEDLPKCPKKKSYWKANKGDWPVGNGTGNDRFICGKSWNHIITKVIHSGMSGTDKAFYTLAQQVIAADLNKAHGAEMGLFIGVKLFFSKSLLGFCHSWMPPLTRGKAYAKADKLEDYNKGYYSDDCSDPYDD